MLSVSSAAVIALVAIIIWVRRPRRHRRQEPRLPAEMSRASHEGLALEAFTRGNTYLAEGRLVEARAHFLRARELDPKRPHVAERLAEVERRQQAVNTTPPAHAHP